jgi:NifU-like protein involved in Fe-S cluster formation
MSIFTIFMAFLVLLALGLTWFFIYYFGNPVLDNPDGIAKVVGNCGDTMEIGLKFRDGRVEETHFWTNGCSFSKICVETAANLARSKTLAELKKINMVSIMDEVGQLPETHLHCAQLAEITLQRSVENYLAGQQTKADRVDIKLRR